MTSRWMVLAIVSSALFMVSIDMTVLHTALPRVVHDLDATNSQKLWMINAYSLVMAGLLPGFGTLGDRIGHRRVFMWGLVVFGLASLAAAFAPSATLLIAARSLLAVGAAMMMPATISLLRLTFLQDRERAIAIGIWGSIASGAAAIGPLIGGALLAHFWWGSVFLINVPVVLATLVLTRLYVPDHPGNPERHWDLWTSALVTVALVGLIYALKEAMKPDPDLVQALAAAGIGVLFGWLFHRRQKGLPSPLIDFALFRNARFATGTVAALIASLALMGVEFVFSQQLQLSRGYTPLQAGLFLLPIAIAAILAGPTVGAVLMRVGVERMLAAMMALTGLGLGLLTLSGDMSLVWQATILAILGFGAGGTMSVASTAIMISAPEDRAGMAGSVESVAYELGGTLGVAILGSLLAAIYSLSLVPPAGIQAGPLVRDSIDQALLAAESLPPDAAARLTEAARTAFDQGALASYGLATVLVAALALAMAIRAWNGKARPAAASGKA
ncbi:MFS transporter [Aquamicrobium terrae]|uniref:DHA2 family multidrug resistance protein-like MFS transporter n=1 Tax=Aquamicrobium terrae TaxID=1324945 RepID=A0ABV2MZ07_9HYPH